MTEKLYLFNPFEIQNWKDEYIEKQYMQLQKELVPDDDLMSHMAHNVEVIANLNYLNGEMIARLTREFADKKLDNDIKEGKAATEARANWTRAHNDKPPAMSYFEALAMEGNATERKKQNEIQSTLARFKYAYESFEGQMNAIKKKMESVKYEEFGGLNG